MTRLRLILLGLIVLPCAFGLHLDAQEVATGSVLNQLPVRISRLGNSNSDSASYWKGVAGQQDAQENDIDRGVREYLNDSDDRRSENESDDLDDEPNDSPVKRATNLTQWPESSLTQIRLDIREFSDQVPEDQSARLLNQYARDWNSFGAQPKTLMWDAPNIRYMPLMFEDVALERYGQVVRGDYFQTVVSAAHFFSSAALLPLHAIHDPVYSCDTPLGYCRPGDCTERIYQRQFWRFIR